MRILPAGDYSYEIRETGQLVALETIHLEPGRLNGVRRATHSIDYRHEVEAELDEEQHVRTLRLRYVRGPFSRSAVYTAGDDALQGILTAMGGRESVEIKLGRFREIDGGLLIFKALLIAHVHNRGTPRWTGRVAVIDPATLLGKPIKQTLFRPDPEGINWVLEPAMGERETFTLDSEGRIRSYTNRLGANAALVGAASAGG